MSWHTVIDPNVELLGGGQRHLRVAIALDAAGGMQVAWPGAQKTFEPRASEQATVASRGGGPKPAAGAAGHTTLQAPMAARVLVVQAQVGSDVPQGAALVVLEAMKMEHAAAAPHHARVLGVHVKAGDQVTQGQRLVTLGPSPKDAAP